MAKSIAIHERVLIDSARSRIGAETGIAMEGVRCMCCCSFSLFLSRSRLSRGTGKEDVDAPGSNASNSYLIDERQQQRQRQRGGHERCTEYAIPRSNLHHNSTTGPSCARRVHVVYSNGYACTTSRACTTRTHVQHSTALAACSGTPAFCIHAHRVAERLPSVRRRRVT